MTPTPYYEDEFVTLYHGTAENLLDQVGPVDVTVTDPPYNVGKAYGDHDDRQEHGDYEAWLGGLLGRCADLAPEVLFFPGVRNLPTTALLMEVADLRWHKTLGWHKREYAGDKWNGGPAMCWEPVVWGTRSEKPTFNTIFGWRGRDFCIIDATHGDPFKGADRHPCPKPPMVMQWLVGLFCPEGGTVLDPFAGTGTTLWAARALGVRAVGIEREERFCELAAERLAQQVLGAAA